MRRPSNAQDFNQLGFLTCVSLFEERKLVFDELIVENLREVLHEHWVVTESVEKVLQNFQS